MKEIRLKNLSIKDFQGGTFNLPAEGKDLFIFGKNTSGKTRLVSAFTWLLFSKDALGRSDFSLKNLDATGEAMHGLEHTVAADLNVDGQTINIKKVFQEKWQKKRGSMNKEFTGHTTNFYIDGVPIQEKDYAARIAEIAGDESRFRLLTSPTTFPSLHWQKQRALLLEVCGDLSDSDVIASNEKLGPLVAILGKHTLEDHRKIVIARRSEINKEMERLPIRIDEVRRGLPDTSDVDREASEKEVQVLETSLNDAKLRLQGVDTGGAIADLSRRLSGLNADLRKMEDAHRSASLSTLNRLNQQISEFDAKVNVLRRRMDSISGDLKWKDGGLQAIENVDLPKLREKWIAIDAESFKEPAIPETCYACGQPLTAERVQEAREKALASFNQGKAERLGEVDRKGQSLKDQRDKLKAEIDALRQERDKIENALPTLEEDLAKAQNDCDTIKRSSEDFSGIQGRADFLDEIEDLESQIKAEREGKAQDIEKIKDEIARLQSDLNSAKTKVDLFRTREQGEKRIEELKISEKTLSAEYERLEGELYLIETFIRTKVSMLTTRINEKFETVRFKLFDLQVNGALAECCQITINGVPFDGGLNNGARINAGLEIVKVLQEHYNLRVPVFADNAEAVNNLVDVGCQMIRLYVSEDKTLRVEVVDERTLHTWPIESGGRKAVTAP